MTKSEVITIALLVCLLVGAYVVVQMAVAGCAAMFVAVQG